MVQVASNYFETLLLNEIYLNQWLQRSLPALDSFWTFLSEFLSPRQILDILLPIMGAFQHVFLVRLVCSLSVLNVLTSLVKWCLPSHRPYWWILEFQHADIEAAALQQQRLSCETTAGFPSAHTISLTAVAYLLLRSQFENCICLSATALIAAMMWLSRMYLGCGFLHQCVGASVAAIYLLHCFDKHSRFFHAISRRVALLVVFGGALLPVSVYFASEDPHWSVRMAFKWCTDVTYLRHEASPIFVLARDYGFLMGVALSAPLHSRYKCQFGALQRILLLSCLETLNQYARYSTPKDFGRFAFVAYEFSRNMLHSYALLRI